MTSFRSSLYTADSLKNKFWLYVFFTTDDFVEWISSTLVTIEMDVQYLHRTTKLANDMKYFLCMDLIHRKRSQMRCLGLGTTNTEDFSQLNIFVWI